MTLTEKIKHHLRVLINWQCDTDEEEVWECCDYSIDLLNNIISELNKLKLGDNNAS